MLAAIDVLNRLEQALTDFLRSLPRLIGFLVILLVGWLIVRVVKAVLVRLLGRLHVDRRLHESPAGTYVERFSPGESPSRLVGGVAFWIIFILALTAAIGVLQIPAVRAFMNRVLVYLPNVIVASLIFVIRRSAVRSRASLTAR